MTKRAKTQELLEKQEILTQAKAILKSEFVGIDHVIEEVVDAISSWYLFSDMQEKPVVINLWGLTGVGKSSLIQRVAELIGFEKRYYQFDLGENELNDRQIKRQLQDIYDNVNGFPILITLDEFQHARTINEGGVEVGNAASRIVWQLLDAGKFQITRYSFRLEDVFNLMLKLRFMLRHGVNVEKGKVITKKSYFIEEMELAKDYESSEGAGNTFDGSEVMFVPPSYYEVIQSVAKERFSTHFEIRDKLVELDGEETLKFLHEVFEIGNSPKIVDCSKSLIFVLGNLDEAYSMSHDTNPDMEADDFHEQSLKINVPDIKNALKKRFRNEQIARLGNTHIIYPAFSKKSFQKIIALSLAKISDKVFEHQGLVMEFDASIHDLIYKEGVYPTQGTRPIFTTIYQTVHTKIGKIITEMMLRQIVVNKILLQYQEGTIHADYLLEDNVIHRLSLNHVLSIENLRKSRNDDSQAIVSVHEVGHAIISAILLRTLPELIISVTADGNKGGFVQTKLKWEYISKKEILSRLALFLGGLVAEKIVFGEEYVTSGAQEDIEQATQFIMKMLKRNGMGSLPLAYHVKDINTRWFMSDEKDKIANEAEVWISKAMILAENTLREQEILLLKMADYLSDNGRMNKKQINQYLQKYARNFERLNLIETGDLLYYRNHLKEKVAAMEDKELPMAMAFKGLYDISLNKKK